MIEKQKTCKEKTAISVPEVCFAMMGSRLLLYFYKDFLKTCRDFVLDNPKLNINVKFVGTQWSARISKDTIKNTTKFKNIIRKFTSDPDGFAIMKYAVITGIDESEFRLSSLTRTPKYKTEHKVQNS